MLSRFVLELGIVMTTLSIYDHVLRLSVFIILVQINLNPCQLIVSADEEPH